METQPVTSSGATLTSSSNTQNQDDDPKSVVSSDFETFLVMLTAQIQNQDPLNPVDSSDYATQLATFSGVEQQVLTNELLGSIANSQGSGLNELANLAGWVGMEARSTGLIAFDGTPRDIYFGPLPDNQQASLVVRTPTGQELHRLNMTGQNSPLTWNGLAPDGSQLLTGNYQLEIETRSADGEISFQPVEAYARVTEVRQGSAGPEIVLSNGATAAASAVSALRQPGQ